MADMHILTGNNSREWSIAMHFVVPNANNTVGVNYRTALVNSGVGVGDDGRRSVLPSGTGAGEITTAEEANLDNGSLFEHIASMRVESGGTSNAELQSTIREFYASENARVQAAIGSRLRYFGHTESAS